jgi:hypothetical protein
VVSVGVVAALTGFGLAGLSGQVQAASAVTVKLTATGACDSNPDGGGLPIVTLATGNITRSNKIRISGRLTGWTPGHSYTDAQLGSPGKAGDGLADLGTADAHGNLTVTNVLAKGGAEGYRGSLVGATVYDTADPAKRTNTNIAIADNCSRLIAGSSHDRLIRGTLRLIQQGDGNLVLYQGGKALWSTRTNHHPGAQTVIQGDGNLAVYSSALKALWSSRTNQNGNPGVSAALVLQDDKNLVLYEQAPVSRVLWATYTD